MIVFEKISWANFLSTGNVKNEVELNKHRSTLITGKNGDGKSTLLCALTFVLFGKPFRNINKNQLINSINRKNCLVEIEFTTNGHRYKIRRGMKPNVFEIYCNGELINQDASVRDYQKVLEQQILKLNYKTFTQVVILGSATFVPFMQLPALQRREVIEDILDIKVFSLMNQILKEKAVAVRDEIYALEQDLSKHKIRIDSQQKLIDVLESNKQEVVDDINTKIKKNIDQIVANTSRVTAITADLMELRNKDNSKELNDALSKMSRVRERTKTKLDSTNQSLSFFRTSKTCSVCAQDIDDNHKRNIMIGLCTDVQEHTHKLSELRMLEDKITAQLEQAKAIQNQITDLNLEISTLNYSSTTLTADNESLQESREKALQDGTNISDEKAKMKQLAEQAIELVQKKVEFLDQRELHDAAAMLLKDTGIKTAIIREYLPVMNNLINKYLTAMDFFVRFELDESFQEVIRSRGRDEFTYASFSEGEKRRLDLAILFTWRQIAKLKNSVNTNILFLDEILDGSLDTAGIDYFLSIMNQFGDQTNVFVISHKVHAMIERFDHVIRVEKKNDFSVMTIGG